MRLIFYIFLISQFFSFLSLSAEQTKKYKSEFNSVNLVKVDENKSNLLKKIIWKSYNNDEIYFGNKIEKDLINERKSSSEKRKYESSKKSSLSLTEIEPFLPLNNFLDYGQFKTSVRWKSSFDGGVSGDWSTKSFSCFDCGISDSS